MATTADSSSKPLMATRRQRLTLLLLLGTQFMLSVDYSVFNVALPTIGHSVGISLEHVSWISTAFALPTAGLTLVFGRVADLVGRRRVFVWGLGTLVAASVLGGLAGNAATLLAARVLQGLATAATLPAAFALLVEAFPEGPLRQRALGMNGALLSAGFASGSLLGGVFTTALSWRWAFWFNVPVALAIIAVAPRVIRESRGGGVRRLDLPGAAAITLGLVALIYGIVDVGEARWASATGWAFVGAGVVALAAFVVIESRSPQPLVPLRMLRRPTVAWGNLGGFVVFAMESAVLFVLTIYLQRVGGYSAVDAGLLLGVPAIASVISGVVAPRVIRRTGSRALLVGGLGLQGAAAIGLLAATGSDPQVPLLLILIVLGFIGHVHALVAFTVTATSGLPAEDQGLATSILTMNQQTAVALGTPLIGTIATAASATGLQSSIHLAIAVDGGITLLVAAAIGLALLRPRTTPTERHP